jgi:hypothetical protein
MAQLDEDIRRLIDRSAVLDVYSAYAWGMDAPDRELFGSVWTADAVWECEALQLDLHGRDEILAYFDKLPGRAPALPARFGSVRLAANPLIELDGDTARGRAEMAAFRFDGDDGVCTYSIGRYDDRLVRTEDGWRIAHREMVVTPVVMPARRAPRATDGATG